MSKEASDPQWRLPRPGSLAPLVLGLFVYLLWPAQALATAMLRFVHAVPGAGAAQVDVTAGGTTTRAGTVAFAEATRFHSVRSGSFQWRLVDRAGKTMASGTATAGSGAYTGVLMLRNQQVILGLYRDEPGRPGTSLLRVIHAAPELGSPELELDSRVVRGTLGFTQATPYLSVAPGVHTLSAMKPGESAPLLSVSGVHLSSDVSYTAIVVGSRGQMVRTVTVVDRGAPLTRVAPVRASSPRPVSRGASGWVTVRPGDSLWRIARERVGSGASNSAVGREVLAIWNANAGRIGTGDPNLIFPGERLHLPPRAA